MNPIYKFSLLIGQNLLNPGTIVPGYVIDYDSGALVENSLYSTSDFIETDSNTYYRILSSDNADYIPYCVGFYDKNKSYIYGELSDNAFYVPSGTVYIRFSFLAKDSNDIGLFTGDNNYTPYETPVYPIYKDDLEKSFELEQNEQFFRTKIAGKLLFIRKDFEYINAANIETRFTLTMFISYNRGTTWNEYWIGEFWKTDCAFNLDDKTVEVEPSPVDDYTNVIAGLEKEYDLIKLKPEISNIQLDKRPLIQIYIPGDSVISCFLSGMYWEQECDIVEDEDALQNTYFFARNKNLWTQLVSGSGVADGYWVNQESPNKDYYWTFEEIEGPADGENQGEILYYTYLTRKSDGARLFVNFQANDYPIYQNFDMYAYPYVEGSEPIVSVRRGEYKNVYARCLLDVEEIDGAATNVLPADDITDSRNYRRAIGYTKDVITFSSLTTSEPTEWGIKEPGVYYQSPSAVSDKYYYPISRSQWGVVSIWFAFAEMDWLYEQKGRKSYTLRDAYPVSSAISALLRQFAPGITHEPTEEYSKFLYSEMNPISGDSWKLFMTPKSNILAGNYDQPAQKAPVTLKQITDMLRDCFCAYWFIEDGKFRIEHISWFKKGGSYESEGVIGVDLTSMKVIRNGKPWSFQTSSFDFEKAEMPERYQFGWMDDVTNAFEGNPINVLSKYVKQGNIQQIEVANFTSDVDYMILNPSECSNDGFALLAAVENEGVFRLPYVYHYVDNVGYINQNGYLAFFNLQPNYYGFDLPAYNVEINNERYVAYGIQRKKIQTLKFPAFTDPNPMQLIKTDIGNGQIEKISINLSSRNANVTLRYDTE